jgi:hypothetical protein
MLLCAEGFANGAEVRSLQSPMGPSFSLTELFLGYGYLLATYMRTLQTTSTLLSTT